MNRKKVAIFLLVIVLFSIIVPKVNIQAAVNVNYYDYEADAEVGDGDLGASSIVIKWAAEILYTICDGVEFAAGNFVRAFTGKAFFPWADKIIFNTIPILDVNFINPAPGSLMKDTSGNETTIGKMIRNMYFTSLSLAIGFLGIVIAVAAIRLAVSTIASEKAKYKEAIVQWLTCIVLLFVLHYLLAFMFYLNERLVVIAGKISSEMLSEASDNMVKKLKAESDKDNEAIVTAFVNRCEKEALIHSIPIVGKVIKFAENLIHSICNAIDAIWKWFNPDKEDAEDKISKSQLGKMYPNKKDYANYFKDKSNPEHEMRINVAAYLLKNKYYRKNYLDWISGNDTNSITESGLTGVGKNILITCNDCLGIVDTGYKALRTIFTSVAMVTYKGGKNYKGEDTGLPYESVAAEANVDSTDEIEEEKRKSALTNAAYADDVYYYQIIKSTKDYNDYIRICDEQISANNKKKDEASSDDDKKKYSNNIFILNLSKIYAGAYYEYVYQGSDKYIPTTSDTVSSLGDFFKQTSWYVDTAAGDWAPTTINVVSTICYAMFIVQSLMFVFAYFKRLFYVVILSVIGPIVVVFDYFKKSMS